MIVLAIVPAVWRRVMDPRVLAHFDGDLSRANLSPRKLDKILAKYPPPAATTVEVPATGAPVVPAALDVLAARCPGCGYTYRVEEAASSRVRGRHRLGRRARRLVLPGLRGAGEGRLRPADRGGRLMRIGWTATGARASACVRRWPPTSSSSTTREVMQVLDESPPEAQRGHVHAAVQACPVLALALVD